MIMSVLKSVTHIMNYYYDMYVWSSSLIYLQLILDSMIMRDRANDLTCSAFFDILWDGSCFCLDTELMRQATDVVNGWELIGPDSDPVYSICRSANTVYTYLIIYFILVLDVWFILHFHSLYCL